MSLPPGSAGPRESDEGTMMVPMMPKDGDVSINFGVKNIALVRDSIEEDDDMDDVEEEK
jgi:hypothetical protein